MINDSKQVINKQLSELRQTIQDLEKKFNKWTEILKKNTNENIGEKILSGKHHQ
jgi:prefoldin subunit 5